MAASIVQLCDLVVPDVVADALQALAQHTGLRWGVMSPSQYWFQSPKLHVMLFISGMVFCGLLQRYSSGFRSAATARLNAAGVGRSLRCPINKLIAYVLIACLAGQVVTKASRPKPFVQLGWLLMPCHIFTAVWIYIFLGDKPHEYGRGCHLASLLLDWLWCPMAALARPDCGDHRYVWEGYIFVLHHGLLLLLPLYFAARYHTLPLDWRHLFHATLVPLFVNFAVFVPCGLLLGLNVNYQLSPPRLGDAVPTVLYTPLYRPVFVVILTMLSVLSNVLTRLLGKVLSGTLRATKRVMKLD